MNNTRARVDGKQHDKRGESDAGGGRFNDRRAKNTGGETHM